jgi:hypothetical protein
MNGVPQNYLSRAFGQMRAACRDRNGEALNAVLRQIKADGYAELAEQFTADLRAEGYGELLERAS